MTNQLPSDRHSNLEKTQTWSSIFRIKATVLLHVIRKKRRTKQKTLQSHNQQPEDNVIIVDDTHDTDSVTSRNHQISEDQVPVETGTRSGHRTEVEQYETALKLKASRAQLLKDVDLNLLRSVAEIAFRQAALKSLGPSTSSRAR
ncbi:hypothetical protein PI124_g4330 [Phytophthora idaei]|nr:hypothetical protein PI125_g4127 [Phytophthora idaei]KAG3147059.1 hypothetical protein PI126_g13020 [Phytophthora idaei]KAG3251072.1 hypothetical protein PI124_g4330 [Phytophthora idaei]